MCRASFLPPLDTGITEKEIRLRGGYTNNLERVFRIKLNEDI